MRNKKRRLELLSFYDHTGIERHLENMAQKGWMIEKMSNYFWTYRRMEPQKLHFTVTYFDKASEFDPGPTQAQQNLFDLCAETGWTLACTWFQMQVFYSNQKSPIPIHTEPTLEVAAIHRACKKSYLRLYKVLFVFTLLATLLFLSSLISDTLRLLASPTDLFTGTVCVLLFLYTLADLLAYYSWHRRAKKQAEYGMFLDTPSTASFQKGILVLLALCLAYWLISVALTGGGIFLALFGAILLCMAAISVSVHAVREFLKHRRVPAGVNRGMTAAASFVIALVLWSGVLALGMQLYKAAKPEDLPLYAEAPLTVEDVQKTDCHNYLTTVSPDESLFLKRLEVYQRGADGESSPDIPTLKYQLYRVKVPALYGFCEAQLKRLLVLSSFWRGTLTEQSADHWGAKKVYLLQDKSNPETYTYLLCYQDLLIQLEINWEPSPEQMAQIGQRLLDYN